MHWASKNISFRCMTRQRDFFQVPCLLYKPCSETVAPESLINTMLDESSFEYGAKIGASTIFAKAMPAGSPNGEHPVPFARFGAAPEQRGEGRRMSIP